MTSVEMATEELAEPPTVLVVDDVADFRGYVARVLQILGYDVVQAEDAPTAMELCESLGHGPDVAVLDVSLPGLSGPELAQYLQQRCEGLGVIYMSGYAAHYLRGLGILPEGAPFLRKPFTLPDVAQALANVRAAHREKALAGSRYRKCGAPAAD